VDSRDKDEKGKQPRRKFWAVKNRGRKSGQEEATHDGFLGALSKKQQKNSRQKGGKGGVGLCKRENISNKKKRSVQVNGVNWKREKTSRSQGKEVEHVSNK